jgi:hypothetical protein
MALPSNDKIAGDLGHTSDHNAIVDEINFIKENYLSASGALLDEYLRQDAASTVYLTQSNASDLYFLKSASGSLLTESEATELYAPLDSPSITGVPTAPTASIGNNSTQLATTEFVSTAIVQAQSGSVDLSAYLTKSGASAIYLTQEDASAIYLPISASANLSGSSSVDLSDYLTFSAASSTYLTIIDAENTYLPISASINFAQGEYLSSSTAAQIYLRQDTASALYSPLISPVFSGVPTAPTASTNNNSLQIATTEFVSNAVLNMSAIYQVVRSGLTTTRSTSSTDWVDVTGATVSITPKFNTSKILLVLSGILTVTNVIQQDNIFANIRIVTSAGGSVSGAELSSFSMSNLVAGSIPSFNTQAILIGWATPNTTSTVTYKVQFKASPSVTISLSGGNAATQLFAMEIG